MPFGLWLSDGSARWPGSARNGPAAAEIDRATMTTTIRTPGRDQGIDDHGQRPELKKKGSISSMATPQLDSFDGLATGILAILVARSLGLRSTGLTGTATLSTAALQACSRTAIARSVFRNIDCMKSTELKGNGTSTERRQGNEQDIETTAAQTAMATVVILAAGGKNLSGGEAEALPLELISFGRE
jgi:hypothetical protein